MSEIVEDGPAPVAAVPAAEPVVEAPADPDEADAVELPAGKHVPLAALKTVREENKTLKAQAANVVQLTNWVNENKPYVDFIRQNPQLLQRQPVAQTPAAPSHQVDPELADIARALDYYKTDGTPDLDRAAKFNTLIDARATKKAQEMVGPVAGTMLNQQAERNWASAVSEKLPNGSGINTQLLSDAWRAVAAYPNGATILADPRAVKVIVNTVKMQQLESGGQLPMPVTPQRNAPVVTEDVGSVRRPSRAAMNETEKGIIGKRMDEAKYNTYTKDFRAGRPNQLEDD